MKASKSERATRIESNSEAEINDDGVLVLKDARSEIVIEELKVKKTDLEGEELAGAEIKIYELDENGEVAKDENGEDIVTDSWTSEEGENAVHTVEGLEVGKSYKLVEEVAPDGYDTVTEITFKVNEDGSVEVEGIETNSEAEFDENGVLVLKDARKEGPVTKVGKLTFTKTVTGGVTKEEAEGALTFTIYNETTKEYMGVDKDGNVSWSTEETEVNLADLSKVDTYKATENKENGTFDFIVEFVVEAGDYTITEKNSAIEGFEEKSTSVKSGDATVAAKGEDEIQLKDDYEAITTTGKLTFTKSVTGGVTKEEAEGALTFTIYSETTNEYMVVDKDGYISWSEQEKEVTLANLSKVATYQSTENKEKGTFDFTVEFVVEDGEYTITEKNSAIEGFEEKSTSVKSGKASVAAKGEDLIELKDDYEKIIETGKLTFTKSVTGGVTEEEAEGKLTFTIQNTTTGKYLDVAEDGTASWTETEKELTLGQLSRLKGYTVDGNAENGFLFTVVLDEVEIGTYTVTEKNSAIEGFELKNTSVTTGEQELVKDGEAQIDLKDDYEKLSDTGYGELTFTKTVKGGVTKEEAEGSLTFTIQNTTTGKYLTIAADGTVEWKEAETAPELTLGQLGKLSGYKVTGDAEKGFLFTVVLDNVEPGKYTISEKNSAIAGYKLTTSSSVTSGSAEITAGEKASIDLKDDYAKETKPVKRISASVVRLDEITGEPVIGVKLQVLDSEGNVIDEWETDGKPHTVTGLNPGETYTIHEAETPDGVKPAEDVKVTITEDGKITGVKLDEDGNIVIQTGRKDDAAEEDVKVSFKISKVDEQGNPLAGAEFVLKDSNGKTVAEWKSEKTAKDISSVLSPGKTYVLEETKAPDGYEICIKL